LKHPIEQTIRIRLPREPKLKRTDTTSAPTKIKRSIIDKPIKDGFVFKNLG
jgi:hypothetical protein